MNRLLTALILCGTLLAPAAARAELTPEQFLRIAEAYQTGYLQLLAGSAVQVYSTAGLVATDFAEGRRDGPSAAEALAETQLLHGVSYATLREIQQATPQEDKQSHVELGKLAAVLLAEKALLLALQDVFSNPTPKNAERVDKAKDSAGELLKKLGF